VFFFKDFNYLTVLDRLKLGSSGRVVYQLRVVKVEEWEKPYGAVGRSGGNSRRLCRAESH